ncbi:MAG TPA: diacylglycerol kinase family protein [Nitrososphaeraceae archaeon]|jgi:diacylglycerol kinase family enzyme
MDRQEQPSTEIALIVNPNSCGGLTGKNWEDLYNEIKKIFGENPRVVFSQKPGHGTIITRELLRNGFEKIVALGGDGTINEVVNGFFEKIIDESNSPHALDTHMLGKQNHGEKIQASPILKPINPHAMMGVVPAGSRNVLAKSLNLPDGIIECCKRFMIGKPQKIDVISASTTSTTQTDTNTNTNVQSKEVKTHLFLNAAEIGVGAEIIDRSKKIRDKVKSRLVSTISSVIATLPTYESNLCEVSIDDGTQNLLLKMTMGVIANGSYLGGGFKAAPNASVSDGLLDVTILKNSGSFKMLDGFVDMRGGSDQPFENNDIFYRQSRKVSIKSKERDITVTVDGEPIGILPGTFQVHPNALTLKF